MVIINLIVKVDIDTWRVVGCQTHPQITAGEIFETEAEAMGFMESHGLSYTTGHFRTEKGYVICGDYVFHDMQRPAVPSVFETSFPELF
jgi:hypothetical protein